MSDEEKKECKTCGVFVRGLAQHYKTKKHLANTRFGTISPGKLVQVKEDRKISKRRREFDGLAIGKRLIFSIESYKKQLIVMPDILADIYKKNEAYKAFPKLKNLDKEKEHISKLLSNEKPCSDQSVEVLYKFYDAIKANDESVNAHHEHDKDFLNSMGVNSEKLLKRLAYDKSKELIKASLEKDRSLTAEKLTQIQNETYPEYPLGISSIYRLLKGEGYRFNRVDPVPNNCKGIYFIHLKGNAFYEQLFIFFKKFYDVSSSGKTLVFIDESNFVNQPHSYKCWFVPKESRVCLDRFDKASCTFIIAVTSKELVYCEFLESNNNADTFLSFLVGVDQAISKKELGWGNYVLYLDNSRIHRAPSIIDFFTQKGIEVLFGVPNYCFYDLCEYVFGHIKRCMKRIYSQPLYICL